VAVKPVAVKTVAVKPVEVKPVAVKPVAVKPVAVKPVAVKPVLPQDLAISDPGASLSPQQFLLDWAREWSAQDVAGYLGSYAAEFKPEGYPSRKAWSKKRRQRLTAPKFIKIKLESIQLVSKNAKLAEVRLIQSYRSDRFSDRTRKSFTLKRAGQSWLIAKERSLGQVR
ncbi:MAG: hypothetical protein L3J63_05305, partial [Geopsychrobacter sp.]|nr:hypothetical protein [Geopsychrobacter sp.]